MIIKVKVKTNAKKNLVVANDDNTYSVTTTVAPAENKANNSVIKLLSEYFNVPSSFIKILKGQRATKKIIEINK